MFHCFKVPPLGPPISILNPGRIIVDASIFKRTSPLAREAHALNSVALGLEYGGPYDSPSPPTISPQQLVATTSLEEPADTTSNAPVPLILQPSWLMLREPLCFRLKDATFGIIDTSVPDEAEYEDYVSLEHSPKMEEAVQPHALPELEPGPETSLGVDSGPHSESLPSEDILSASHYSSPVDSDDEVDQLIMDILNTPALRPRALGNPPSEASSPMPHTTDLSTTPSKKRRADEDHPLGPIPKRGPSPASSIYTAETSSPSPSPSPEPSKPQAGRRTRHYTYVPGQGRKRAFVTEEVLTVRSPCLKPPALHLLPDNLIGSLIECMHVVKGNRKAICVACGLTNNTIKELGAYSARHVKEIHNRPLAEARADGILTDRDEALLTAIVAVQITLPRCQPKPLMAELREATELINLMRVPAAKRDPSNALFPLLRGNARQCNALCQKALLVPPPCPGCGKQFGRFESLRRHGKSLRCGRVLKNTPIERRRLRNFHV